MAVAGSLMDYFIERGRRRKTSPCRLSDESTETIVMGGIEVVLRRPFRHIDEPVLSIGRERAVQPVSDVTFFLAHVVINLLPQR